MTKIVGCETTRWALGRLGSAVSTVAPGVDALNSALDAHHAPGQRPDVGAYISQTSADFRSQVPVLGAKFGAQVLVLGARFTQEGSSRPINVAPTARLPISSGVAVGCKATV